MFLGGAKEMFGRMSFYVQLGTLSMVAINFWDTTIVRNFRDANEWFTFPLFIAVVAVIGFILLFLEYVIIMPGSYAFSTWQFNKHKNEMLDTIRDIQRVQKEQGEIIEKIYKKGDDK